MNRMQLARAGEDLVCQKLEQAGWRVQQRNFRILGAELDIIAIKENTCAIVEVKTRNKKLFLLEKDFDPQKLVSHRQLLALSRGLTKFIQENASAEKIDCLRLDLALITFDHKSKLKLDRYWVDFSAIQTSN